MAFVHPRLRALLLAFALTTTAGAVVAPKSARAQTVPPIAPGNGNGFDLHLFRQAVDSKGHFAVNGTDILGAGNVSFGFIGDVGMGLLRNTNAAGMSVPLVPTMLSGVLSANVGIANLLVVGAQLPVHIVSGDGRDPQTEGNFARIPSTQLAPAPTGWGYSGFGDVVVHAKLRWLRVEYFPVGLAIIVQGGFGIGGARSFVGEPGPWVWPSAAVEWRPSRRLRIDANLGFRMPFGAGSTIGAVTYGPSITWGAGVSYRVLPVMDLVAETYGNLYATSLGQIPRSMPMEVVAGIKVFVLHNSYLMLGGGVGVPGSYAAPDARAFVGIVLEPSIGDSDGDSYTDDVDHCVSDPEDFDGFQDDDGCSDPDNDRDGILDGDDQCPNVPEDRDGDADGDGCPEGAESDSDGDGIVDSADRCVDDPEDRDGFEDTDGCPDLDNDRDELPDLVDACPNEPEDRDQFEDEDGCPDPDNDQDGILDPRDQCPNEAEVMNGVDDEDGCPDSGDLQILGNVINLRQQIQFETDSAEIRAVSFPILEQMAELMRHNAQFELVEVEGHTDERAPDDHNLHLSLDRANSVMQALVQRGVAAERLVAAGYGEYCPLDPAHNARAWERNRRVQFIIVRTRDEGRTTATAGCRRAAQYIPPTVGPPGTGVARERGGADGSGSSSSAAP